MQAMIFHLSTAGFTYDECDKLKLESVGFEFTCDDLESESKIYRKLDGEKAPTVEIDTLEQLLEFQSVFGRIIVYGDGIKIYDDFLRNSHE